MEEGHKRGEKFIIPLKRNPLAFMVAMGTGPFFGHQTSDKVLQHASHNYGPGEKANIAF